MPTIIDPTFLITFDTELLWGIRFQGWSEDDEVAALRTRDDVMPAILELLDEMQIPATFAVVGHLLVSPSKACYPPTRSDRARDWYESISDNVSAFEAGFQWPELPDLLSDCRTDHEVALHSFSHWHFEDPATTDDLAEFEIETNRAMLKEARFTPSRSVVFPRNRPGQLPAVRRAGVNAYRGADPNWYRGLPGAVGKLGHVVDAVCALSPPTSTDLHIRSGIVNIPGSLLLWSTQGFRRRIPRSCRTRQVRKGLRQAIRGPALFHLWMHPINLAYHPERMLATLRECLEIAGSYREQGQLRVMTMAELALQCGGMPATDNVR